jgi:hypothetical protein
MRKIAIFILGMLALSAHAREMSVQVREGQLRAAPSFLSPVRELIPYTERVRVLTEQGDWMQVQRTTSPSQGWMHQSALTRKKLAITAGERQATQGVTTDEQALAGKGFNPQVESEFRNRNPQANFAAVDTMEKRETTPAQLQRFLVEGGLVKNNQTEAK